MQMAVWNSSGGVWHIDEIVRAC